MPVAIRDVRHLRIRSSHLRALLHEAWKNGNDSLNIHSEPAGHNERHNYVSKVMVEQGFTYEKEISCGQ